MKKIAVVIPCYNEDKVIEKVVTDFRKQLPEASIFVFDNNSTDYTAEKAKNSGATVFFVQNRGKGNVLKAIFEQIEADIYIMVDGDDTYSPDNVREMIAPLMRGEAEMVLGDRMSSNYLQQNKRRFHNSGNLLITGLINKMFKSNLHDVLTGYRVFSKKFVNTVLIRSEGFEIETELTFFALQHRLKVKEITVSYRNRMEGNPSKLHTYKDGYRILKTLMILFRDYKPFIFFSWISFFIGFLGVILLFPVFLDYFKTGLVERFPTLIFGCFLLMVAAFLFCSGLILQIIIRNNQIFQDIIHKNLKGFQN